MWIKTLQFRLTLLINTSVVTLQKESKEHLKVQALSKTPIKIMKLLHYKIIILQIRIHISILLFNERIRQKDVFGKRASEENTSILAMTYMNVSDWSLHS